MAALIHPSHIAKNETTILRLSLPIRENLRNMPWFFGSMLIVIFPSLAWIYSHPNDFLARWSKEGLIQSGWLKDQLINTGQSVFMILLERLIHVCQAIFILPFQDFYWAPAPVLDLITSILFIVGAFLAIRRTRDPKILLLNGWFWSGVVSIAFFAIPPSADFVSVVYGAARHVCAGCAGLGAHYIPCQTAGTRPTKDNCGLERRLNSAGGRDQFKNVLH